MLPECRRADPEIDSHVEDRSSRHAQELALSVRRNLKMQAADRTGFRRQCMVVLDEFGRDARYTQFLAAKGLREKASRVAMNSRNEELDVYYGQGPYFQNEFLVAGSGHTCSIRSNLASVVVVNK